MADGVVIIGGGQAGAEAASALRVLGYGEPILLIGEEPQAPYQRPPLSKEYLAGRLDAGRLPLRAESYYDKQRIGLLMGQRVVTVDPQMQRLRLKSGAVIPYDHLILAVGARNRPLPVKGAERALYLRNQAEADEIAGTAGRGAKRGPSSAADLSAWNSRPPRESMIRQSR